MCPIPRIYIVCCIEYVYAGLGLKERAGTSSRSNADPDPGGRKERDRDARHVSLSHTPSNPGRLPGERGQRPAREVSGWPAGSFGKAGHVIGWRRCEQFDFRLHLATPGQTSLSSSAAATLLPFPSLPLPTSFSPFPVMASRRLAFNLNQALRSRAALKAVQPVRRGFASPVTLPSRTQSTTLSNGLTVRSHHPVNGCAVLLTRLRSRPSTSHGLRPRPSACGSTPEAGPKPTRPTARRTSLSTWPSRYIPLPINGFRSTLARY